MEINNHSTDQLGRKYDAEATRIKIKNKMLTVTVERRVNLISRSNYIKVKL